jgi:group I intron endonuclease
MIGIYRITNPKGEVYIGQSRKVEKRIKYYNSINSSAGQVKLYNSFLTYGIENHKFDIVEECDVLDLNIRERYWQDFYNSVTNGLNTKLTSKTKSNPNVFNGRKAIDPSEKKTLIRVFVKKKVIDAFTKEEPKQGTMSEAIKQVINNQLKQETFEEAAKSHAIYELENNYKPTKESFKLACKRSFIQCAKWQQDQINCELSELLEFVKSLANESDDIVHPEIKKVAEQLIKK